jgi:nitrate reductase alpha subunit
MAKPKIARVAELEAAGDKKAESTFNDEQRALMSSPTGKFVVVQVSDGFRVAKNHQWISGSSDNRTATLLCSDLNRKDPEQKPYNRYLMGNPPPMRGKGDIQGLGE